MKSRFSFLPLVAAVLAVLVSLPVASVVVNIFQPDKEDVWAHLAETVLAEYVFNSLALAVGAGLGAALLGRHGLSSLFLLLSDRGGSVL